MILITATLCRILYPALIGLLVWLGLRKRLRGGRVALLAVLYVLSALTAFRVSEGIPPRTDTVTLTAADDGDVLLLGFDVDGRRFRVTETGDGGWTLADGVLTYRAGLGANPTVTVEAPVGWRRELLFAAGSGGSLTAAVEDAPAVAVDPDGSQTPFLPRSAYAILIWNQVCYLGLYAVAFTLLAAALTLLTCRRQLRGTRLERIWQGFLSYRFLLRELVKKGIVLKYRRSYLGLLWTLLQPLLDMMVLAFVFGTLFGNQDRTWAVYILSGRLVFSMFSAGTSAALRAIRANADMIKKVYVPKYLYPLSAVTSSFVIFLLSLADLVLMLLVKGVTPTVYILLSPLPLIVLFLLCYGVGMLLSVLGVYFRDVEYLWGVVLTLLMYLCALFYYPDMFYAAGFGWVLEYNPLFCLIDTFRSCVYLGEMLNWGRLLYAFLCSFVTIALGTLIFARKQDRFILHI